MTVMSQYLKSVLEGAVVIVRREAAMQHAVELLSARVSSGNREVSEKDMK